MNDVVMTETNFAMSLAGGFGHASDFEYISQDQQRSLESQFGHAVKSELGRTA